MALLSEFSNAELLARVRSLIESGNSLEADLLAHLGEIDARRLYAEEGFSSMFIYCVRVLHFAEAVAYKRIQAARAARSHPELLEALRHGDLHLTAIGLLAPRLDRECCAELIAAARHCSAEEVKQLLADREPRPAVPAVVRRLPAPAVPATSAPSPRPTFSAPPRPAVTSPLGEERYRVQFTANRETHDQLQELRGLMRHQIADGDVGRILARAISALLIQVRKRKFAETSSPKTPRSISALSRHIPAAIRRAVWARDAGRCTYASKSGRRCDSREFVEFDHIETWARTQAHSIAGITLRCRAHNQLRARNDFGEERMARFMPTGLESSPNP